MKAAIKNTKLYKALRFRRWVLWLANPDVYANLAEEQKFYEALVHDFDIKRVFDIGANIGFTAEALLKAGVEELVAVEPDRYNYSILQGKLGNHTRSHLVNMAAGEAQGNAILHRHISDGALHSLSLKYAQLNELSGETETVGTTTLDALIASYGQPDYIKIDVEGYEPAVIRGLSLIIPLVSFECNMPDFKAEGQACVEHLASLSSGYVFNYTKRGHQR